MKQLAAAKNEGSACWIHCVCFFPLARKKLLDLLDWSGYSKLHLLIKSKAKKYECYLAALREHSYWFGKFCSVFLCNFPLCSLHWEFYRGPIVASVISCAILVVRGWHWYLLFGFIWVLPNRSNLELVQLGPTSVKLLTSNDLVICEKSMFPCRGRFWERFTYSYESRIRVLKLFSLEKRRLLGDLIAAFQYLKGTYKKDGDKLFSRACCNRTRGNGFKLRESRFGLYMRKKFFTIRVVKHWNMLPRKVVDAPSLETFKVRLEGALGNLI